MGYEGVTKTYFVKEKLVVKKPIAKIKEVSIRVNIDEIIHTSDIEKEIVQLPIYFIWINNKTPLFYNNTINTS